MAENTNNTANEQATANQQQAGEQEKRTFTQEEMNAIIQDRLKRETAKYSDYEDLKAKATEYDKVQEAGKSELQKATEKATELQKQLDALKNENSLRDIRDKVAKETGVPASLLSGNTEDECKEQAKAILAFSKPGYPNVKDGGNPQHTSGSTTREQFRDWFNQAIS